ncbi:uncharacterized protein BXIN_1845 [Babesia sp. Xinjiang]|uniref:uncharacterized protein n=1 Tax=Babesia sp. Xinjiang TaxID=462227 RepID=UPI000A24EF96|nr:uncharacterized protein BXIN_1845 [Babesia sp. Xinjiang]ORM40473.1 hypothetical protein BXIN_1845 [Babesia sp. Xinjiang]
MVKPTLVVTLLLCALEAVRCFKLPIQGAKRNIRRSYVTRATDDASLLEIDQQNVEKVLDLIRPQIENDGGKLTLVGIDDHDVQIQVSGAFRSTIQVRSSKEPARHAHTVCKLSNT